MKITLSGERPWSWNIMYSGIHWATRAKEAARVHELIWFEYLEKHRDLSAAAPPIFENRVDILITAYFKDKIQDSDNICDKPYVDGLIGIWIADDTPEFVRRVSTQAEIDEENPRMEIEITEVQDG